MRSDRTSTKRVIVVAAVVVATIAIGSLLTAIGRPQASTDGANQEPTLDPRPVVPIGVAGPVAEKAGLPVGFADDQDGAVAAAVVYATAPQRWLYFSDEKITAAVAEIATPAAAPRLGDEVLADVRTAREKLGSSPGRVWWLVRPLAWRAVSFDPDQATVAVWTVTVLSAERVAVPQSDWVTVTVDLAWVDGDWRIDGVRDTPGPTPLSGPNDQPWDAVPFDKALTGFTRIDGEPTR